VLRERCSCGAEFETDEKEALKLVREWRRKHVCVHEEVQDTHTSGTAQVEHGIGFTLNHLEVPARSTDPWDE
jgi:hypothetical protein